jgi:hypothetical protein
VASAVGTVERPHEEYGVGGRPAAEKWYRQHAGVLGVSAAIALVIIGMLMLALSLGGRGHRRVRTAPGAAPIVQAAPSRPDQPAPANAEVGGAVSALPSAPATSFAPGAPAALGASPTPGAAPTAGGAAGRPRATFEVTSTRMRRLGSSEDQMVLRRISDLSWPDGSKVGSSVDVLVDLPRGDAIVTFQTRENVKQTELAATILTGSFRFAREVFAAEPEVDSVIVRALYALGGKAEEGATNVVAFRGTISRSVVTPFGQNEPGVVDLARGGIFSEMWWQSDISRLLQTGASS